MGEALIRSPAAAPPVIARSEGRHALYLLASLAFDTYWITWLTRGWGARAGGGAIPWSALLAAAIAILLWLGWAERRVNWARPRGKLLATTGVLIVIGLLLGRYATGGALLADGATWSRAISRLWMVLINPAPASLVLFAGLLLWQRAHALLHRPVDPRRSADNFAAATLALVVVLLVGVSWGGPRADAGVFLFLLLGLLAFTLARVDEAALVEKGRYLRLEGRWLAVLGAGFVLLAAAGALLALPAIVGGSEGVLRWLAPLAEAARALLLALLGVVWRIVTAILRLALGDRALVFEDLWGGPGGGVRYSTRDGGGLPVLLFTWLLRGLLVAAAGVGLYALFTGRVPWRGKRRRAAASRSVEATALPDGGFSLRRALDALRERREARRREFGVQSARDLYRNLLAFGDAAGIPRPDGDTPYEYFRQIVARYPQRRDDFLALTEAYIAARYGERDLPPPEVARLRDAWGRIRELE